MTSTSVTTRPTHPTSSTARLPPTTEPSGGAGGGVHTGVKATYGLAAFLVFAIVLVVLTFVRRRCVSKRDRRSREDSRSSTRSAPSDDEEDDVEGARSKKLYVKDPQKAAPECVPVQWNSLPENVKYLLKGHVIDIRKIVLGKVIGKGHFGCVYEATLLQAPAGPANNDYVHAAYEKVAAKTLKGDNPSVELMEAFLREGMIMKDFQHRHVLSLVGVAIDQRGVPLIVLPYMHHGCLKKYIRSSDVMLTVRDLLVFGHQVADGMKYLAERKFVHRDLAARNCMLDEHLDVKVADFGLSRDIFMQDYYMSEDKKTKLPVKWMSPESLTKAAYSVKSDVWSYGVLLWELLTRGSTPYPDVSIWDVRAYIQAGRRMDKPEVCPEEIYELMLRCWDMDSKKRPSFDEIYQELHALLYPQLDDDDVTEEGGVMEHDYINIYRTVTAVSQEDGEELDKFALEDFQGESQVILDSHQGAAHLDLSRFGSAV